MTAPAFPPLLSGQAVTDGDPFRAACAAAAQGCEAGTILYHAAADHLRAALVLAPEVPLGRAMAMLPACGVGLQNALGALAPPEIAVHLDWDGGIRVNGARCGALRAAADTSDPGALPGWLVVALDLPLLDQADRPGDAPDRTTLGAEGCAGLDPVTLLEAWARHTLVWIARWEEPDGPRALHAAWAPLADGIGREITQGGIRGRWLGVDEDFAMLLDTQDGTTRLPLTSLLEPPA